MKEFVKKIIPEHSLNMQQKELKGILRSNGYTNIPSLKDEWWDDFRRYYSNREKRWWGDDDDRDEFFGME